MPEPDLVTVGRGLVTVLDRATLSDGIEAVVQNSTDEISPTILASPLDIVEDANPPETIRVDAFGRRDGLGLFRSAVTLRPIATDDISGVATISLSVDGGQTWDEKPVDLATWTFDANGIYAIQVRATDMAGNVEEPKAVEPFAIVQYVAAGTGSQNSLEVSYNTGLRLNGPVFGNNLRLVANTNTEISDLSRPEVVQALSGATLVHRSPRSTTAVPLPISSNRHWTLPKYRHAPVHRGYLSLDG